jgi:hypothetical protein
MIQIFKKHKNPDRLRPDDTFLGLIAPLERGRLLFCYEIGYNFWEI